MRWRQAAAGDIVPEAWGGWVRPLCPDSMQSGFRWACATHEMPGFVDLGEMQAHVASGDDVHQIVVRCGIADHDAEGPRP